MSTLTLSIASNYVPDWKVPHIVRELIQNGQDSEKLGYPLTVDATDGGKVKITNEGVTLNRSTLLLGGGTKTDGGFAGKFGEGYKLAALAALRLGIDFRVRTSDESWQFFLSESVEFGGAPVVKVKITKAPTYVNRVTFQLDAGDNMDLKNKLVASMIAVRLDPKAKRIETPRGSILTAAEHQGCIYSHGLLVTKLPTSEGAIFGYDLPDLDLNRDRSIPDISSLQRGVAFALLSALEAKALPDLAVLLGAGFESRSLATVYSWEMSSYRDGLTRLASFLQGSADTLVSTPDEAAHAEARGVSTRIAPKAIVGLCKGAGAVKSVEEIAVARGRDVQAAEVMTATLDESVARYSVLRSIVEAADMAGIKRPELRVVRFFDDGFAGTHLGTSDLVSLSVGLVEAAEAKAPGALGELIQTYVHELAHRVSDAHDDTHTTAMQRMFGDIIAALIG